MTQPEPVVARAEGPAAGVIYDIGYHGYDGPRLGRRAALWALFTFSWRAAFARA